MSTVLQHDLFVSFTDADHAWVEGYLFDALERAGVRFHSEAAFELGVPRLVEFERAIQSSRRTLLVISPAYLADGANEFVNLLSQTYGLEASTWQVIPLLLHPAQLPPRLAMLTVLDATQPENHSAMLRKLLETLGRSVPAPAAIPPCPYPGMVPFAETDSASFFGRTRETQELVQLLRMHPFLAVIGASGSGKSSLVFAGLIPALRTTTSFGAGEWQSLTMRPGENPLGMLASTLASVQPAPSDRLVRTLLVVDQFEEAFTLARTNSQTDLAPFLSALSEFVSQPRHYVVLTVRADFYADLMNSPLWNEIRSHRYEVIPLTETGLAQAIVRPAEQVGVFVESTLVERLVSDAANEPGVLPLIQETLVLLWDKVERRFLPLRAYETLVLPRSSYGANAASPRTGLQVAIALRADAAYATLTPAQQILVRRILLRLIHFGQGRADTRRQQPRTALLSAGDDLSQFETALACLVNNRLVTTTGADTEKNDGAVQVDIAHEALITGWPLLQTWLREWRQADLTRRRLEDKSAEWIRLGQGDGGLLDDVELLEAERWLASPDSSEIGYSPALVALVDASKSAREKLAMRLASEKRLRARQRYFALGIGALALVLLALGYFAFQQRQVARSRELANRALAQLNQDPEVAMLIAREALAAADTTEAQDAMRQALVQSHVRRVLPVHRGAVWSAAYSPNGLSVVTASADNTARIVKWSGNELVVELVGHTGAVRDAQFSPDNSLVVTASEDGTARIWDAVTGALRRELRGHIAAVRRASFSPDNQFVVTASEDNTARIWNLASGENIILEGHTSPIMNVRYSRDGALVLTASGEPQAKAGDYSARLWNAATGELLGVLQDSTLGTFDGVWDADISPNGRYVATASKDSVVRVWDLETGVVRQFKGHGDFVRSVRFSTNGLHLVSASFDNTTRVWDVETGNSIVLVGHIGFVNSAEFSADDRFIVTASNDNTARVWNAVTGESIAVLRGHTGIVWTARFQFDGKTVLTASDDGTARIWDSGTDSSLFTMTESAEANDAAWSPNGRFVVTACLDGNARVWPVVPVSSGEIYLAPEPAHVLTNPTRVGYTTARYSPNGKLIVTASADHSVQIWDAATGEPVRQLPGGTGAVLSAVFSPDNNFVAAGGVDAVARIWRSDNGQLVDSLSGHTARIRSVAYSSDGKKLVTAGEDTSARVWDLATKQSIELPGVPNFVESAAFTPDGKTVMTASYAPLVRLWDTTNWQNYSILRAHADSVWSVNASSDSRWLVTASSDHTVRLWDAIRAQNVAVLRGHTSTVWSAVFSPDNRFILTASRDKTVRIFACEVCGSTTELVALAKLRATRELSSQERTKYLD